MLLMCRHLFLFIALNRPDAKDTDIEMLRDVIVDSLFSVLVSLGKLFLLVSKI